MPAIRRVRGTVHFTVELCVCTSELGSLYRQVVLSMYQGPGLAQYPCVPGTRRVVLSTSRTVSHLLQR